jgi:hypothetical protein
MTQPPDRLHFTGSIHVQFVVFLQGLMQTEPDGSQVFIGSVRGLFGTPPDGTLFQATVKLSVGAEFKEDAYEVAVHPALAELGARPELRAAAFRYVDQCISSTVGPGWRHSTGLTMESNVFQVPGEVVRIDFDGSSEAW